RVPAEVPRALGEPVAAIDSAHARSIEAPTGTRRIADGIAIFLASDDETAIAAAASLKAGVVIGASGLIVLPGLVRHGDAKRRGDQDARTQLRGMATRLRQELGSSE